MFKKKNIETAVITIRTEKAIKDKLTEIAQSNESTLNSVCDVFLKQGIEGYKPKPTLPSTRQAEPKRRFTPPTQTEAEMYFLERECPTAKKEAEKFIDFYSSKGWMVGKNKMKDWKAAVRNWLKNYKPDNSERTYSSLTDFVNDPEAF